jgi:iduronate 2-sulfatase
MILPYLFLAVLSAIGNDAAEYTQYAYRNHQLADTNSMKQTNLLFIIFDDLRTELSIYGKKHMITPNFERLAKKAVTFENAYSQVAVCNPSRDSLLTGLRPDTMGTYGFQSTFRPFLLLPTQLARSGYKTAGYGKIRHYEGFDREVWNDDEYDGKWYDYQYLEWTSMNSSVMPDKYLDEKLFRDYIFASKAIESLERLSRSNSPFMIAVGFKMPHLSLHVPYRAFDMYRNMTSIWMSKPADYLTHPPTVPMTGRQPI